jgi:hypothetical protein
VHRAEQVGQRPEALAGVVAGELRAEPLAQQPRAATLDRVLLEGRVRGQRRVELGQRAAGQRGLRLEPGGTRVGQPVVAGPRPEGGGDDRVEVADGVDVAVGDGAWGGHRIRSSRADMLGRSGPSGPARSIAYISAPSTMP